MYVRTYLRYVMDVHEPILFGCSVFSLRTKIDRKRDGREGVGKVEESGGMQ